MTFTDLNKGNRVGALIAQLPRRRDAELDRITVIPGIGRRNHRGDRKIGEPCQALELISDNFLF